MFQYSQKVFLYFASYFGPLRYPQRSIHESVGIHKSLLWSVLVNHDTPDKVLNRHDRYVDG